MGWTNIKGSGIFSTQLKVLALTRQKIVSLKGWKNLKGANYWKEMCHNILG